MGYYNKQGSAGGFSGSVFNFYYNAGPVQCWIDNTNLGNLTISSDYRIKKDVVALPTMWTTVRALRPIKYTQADFTPPAQQRAAGSGPMFPADSIERWGFIAHELQATLVPSAATGVKDAADTIQSPNPFTVLAAVTKALQEAMTRIEALEASIAA
jgi:hypothetical protein